LPSGPTKPKPRPRFRALRIAFRVLAWPVLAGVLAFQLRIVSDQGLRLPGFAARELESRLAARGLVLHADELRLDPSGRLALRGVRAGLTGDDSPFLTADALAIDFRRPALLNGVVEPLRVDITGLSLNLPARRSPSGSAQALLTGGEFLLTRASTSAPWQLDNASGRLFGVATTFHGQLVIPAAPAGAPAADPLAALVKAIEDGLSRAADITRHTGRLPLAAVPALEIELGADRLTISADIPRLDLNLIPGLPPALAGSRLEQSRLVASVPLAAAFTPDLASASLLLDTGTITLPSLPPPIGALTLNGVRLDLRPDLSHLLSFNAKARLSVHSITSSDTTLPSPPLLLSAFWFPLDDRLSLDLTTSLADAPWRFSAGGRPHSRSGTVAAAGSITPDLVELIKSRLPTKAREAFSVSEPIDLVLAADFADGAKPKAARLRFKTGAAVAHGVTIDRAGGQVVVEGKQLNAFDLFLVQGENSATGTYDMDIETLDYRFLLGGRLRPMGIEGWFTGWWDNLWANFDFSSAPPEAEADIAGTWGHPDRSTVFVAANQNQGVKLRDLAVDRLACRVWVGAHSTDILGFHVTQGDATATGRVTRIIDIATDTLQRMVFNVTSNLPPESITQLFREEGREIVEPFVFSAPPALHLAGEVFGPGSGADDGRQNYNLDLVAGAPFTFHGFPLDRAALRLERVNSDMTLRDIRAGFADGTVTGHAVVSGPPESRWLAFEAKLDDAPADKVLTRWHEFQLTRPLEPGAAPPVPPKPLGGRLNLTLTATGPLDDPLAFSGGGAARITGADLARIRLLGLFSELLNGLGLGFSTLKLSDADARFNLNRRVISFERLHFTGSNSPVEARGDYTLPEGGLAFTARVLPFNHGGILGNTAGLVLSPFASALEVELGGTLDKPSWSFAYGPRKLLRKITGQFTPSPKPSAAAGADAPPGMEPPPESPRQPGPVLR
jgi:hypothetical protein